MQTSKNPRKGDRPNTDAASALLTTPEAARALGLSASTLNKWRCHGGGPVFVKLGRAVREVVPENRTGC